MTKLKIVHFEVVPTKSRLFTRDQVVTCSISPELIEKMVDMKSGAGILGRSQPSVDGPRGPPRTDCHWRPWTHIFSLFVYLIVKFGG